MGTDPLPDFMEPQLAALVQAPPDGADWLHEIKYDGYRIIARLENGRAQLFTRSRLDWTHRFPSLARAVEALPARQAMLDGEAVVLGSDGRTDFQALQNAMRGGQDISPAYILFDMLHLDGQDMRQLPLLQRKERLSALLARARLPLVAGPYQRGGASEALARACSQGLEGVVSKRMDAPYTGRRSPAWRKTKCILRQEVVIGGFTAPADRRADNEDFGALLVGVYPNPGTPQKAIGQLHYLGRVGTGFDDATRRMLMKRLLPLAAAESPFGPLPAAARKGVRFVTPVLVAEAQFRGITTDGLLRQASFKGLREDKPASQVVAEGPLAQALGGDTDEKAARDQAQDPGYPLGPVAAQQPAAAAGGLPDKLAPKEAEAMAQTSIRLTHPERVLYPADGITKADVAEYYRQVAPYMLPHIAGRPLTLVRCPEGIGGECFHQRHPMPGMGSAVRSVEAELSGELRTFLAVDSPEGLVALVQFGAMELHPWNVTMPRADLTDLLIFDLDPGPGVAWEAVVAASLELHTVLKGMGLSSFAKTSGGKGYHLVVPLRPAMAWEPARAFAAGLAQAMAQHWPDRYVAVMSKAVRSGKIFIDYLRNAPGATSVAVYSTRARPGAPVSAPVSWAEVEAGIAPDAVTIRTMPQRLRTQRSDPWEGFFAVRQGLPR